MWICPTCGEAHDDRFKECWKCAGAEMEQGGALPRPLPPAQERELRSFASILVRAASAFVIGAMLGVAIGSRTAAAEPAALAWSGFLVGSAFAGVIGLFVWVFFPYKPLPAARDKAEGSAPME
jgi:hypothetical protein